MSRIIRLIQSNLDSLAVGAFKAALPKRVFGKTSVGESSRVAVQSRLTQAHLLASSAIPFVFPATPLQVQGEPGWFGDGSMRQTALPNAAT